MSCQNLSRSFAVLMTVCAGVVNVGCGDGAGAIYPVRGTISYNGLPVTTGTVAFTPLDPSHPAARGQIQSDGSYSLSTYRADDGAAVGEHVVVIHSFSKPTVRPDLDADDPRQRAPVPLVPERYTVLQQTPLRATVETQANEISLTLKD